MTGVLIACITVVGAIIVALIERGRKQNSREHSETISRIDRVISTLGRVEHKVDSHLNDHEKGDL